MSYQQQGAVIVLKRLLQLLYRRQVEMIGGLVENQQVRLGTDEQRKIGASALARRQGAGLPQDVIRSEAELGQQRPGIAGSLPGVRAESVKQRAGRIEGPPRRSASRIAEAAPAPSC